MNNASSTEGKGAGGGRQGDNGIMVDLVALTKRFDELTAVDNLTLRVPRGELFAFLGPNGAGKTTTIKMMTGLLGPTEGAVRIGGIDIQEHPTEAKSLIGFVPDVAVFYEKLTAWEFMEFIADLFGVDEGWARQNGAALFRRFELEEVAGKQIETLSHGTRQRLAIASALLHDPEVLIIDEPMIGLDPLHARTVKEELRRRSDSGMTVFMSTHLLNVAEELADRIGIIHRGRIIALGTMEELKEQAAGGETALEEIFLRLIDVESRGG